MKRPEDEHKLEERKINDPDYQLENILRDEIYGLRDNMLPKELGRVEYAQISVYPGYNMDEYFLLERKGE